MGFGSWVDRQTRKIGIKTRYGDSFNRDRTRPGVKRVNLNPFSGAKATYSNYLKPRPPDLGGVQDAQRQLGQRMAGFYDERAQRNMGYLQPAQNWLQTYGSNGGPSQVRSLYQSQAGRGLSPLPNYSQTHYQSSGAYQPQQSRTQLLNRQMTGYGPNQVADRYTQRSQSPWQSPLAGQRASVSSFASGPTTTGQRYQQLQQQGPGYLEQYSGQQRIDGQSNYLMKRMDERRAAGPSYLQKYSEGRSEDPVAQKGILGELTGAALRPDRIDSTRGEIGGMRSNMGQAAQGVRGLSSATGRLMTGFDPRQTETARQRYDELRQTGPDQIEDWFEKLQTQSNPYFERLAKQQRQASDDAAAARGGFNSGRLLKRQDDAEASLRAEQFGQMGDLAQAASASRAGRRREVTEAAFGVEDVVGRNRDYLGNLASATDDFNLQRTGMMTDVLGRDDDFRLQRAGLGADLAVEGDRFGLEGRRLRADVARGIDDTSTTRLGMRDDLAGNISGEQERRQLALDDLSGKADDSEIRRQELRDRLAVATGEERQAIMQELNRMAVQTDEQALGRRRYETDYLRDLGAQDLQYQRDMDQLSNDAATQTFERERQIDTLSKYASDEGQSWADYLQRGAFQTDSLALQGRDQELAWDRHLLDAAQGASGEEQTYYDTMLRNMLGIGAAQSGIASQYDQLSGGAMRDSEIAALDMELQRMGYSAKERQAMLNNIGAGASIGGQVGGPWGAGIGGGAGLLFHLLGSA